MRLAVEQFLEQVAKRGSWVGGGSVAAFTAALAAALLEKLVVKPQLVVQLKRIRRHCLWLLKQDARTFSSVIAATRANNRRGFVQALKAATEVPAQVFEHAQTIQAACRRTQRVVKPRFQSDLRCAMAVALAAAESARTLIHTNLAWLNDDAYTRKTRRRLLRASRRYGR